jgi:hypothetical protein
MDIKQLLVNLNSKNEKTRDEAAIEIDERARRELVCVW